MARTLSELQKQYNSMEKGGKRGGGGHGPGGPRIHGGGKPKNVGATVKRLLRYVGVYKVRLILVFLSMILHTAFFLCGSYLIAPIINRITLAVNPLADISPSAIEKIADRMIESFVSMPWISSLMGTTASAVTVYVFTALLILAVIYFLAAFTNYLQSRLMLEVTQNSIEKIRYDLFTKMQSLPVRYYDANPTGEVMSRYTNDIDNIDTMLSNSLMSIVSGVITLIGTFLFMLTTNVYLTLITVLFIPVFVFGGGIIAKRSSKYYIGQQAALGAVNGYIEETVSGQKVIKVFNHEETCIEEFGTLNEDLRDKQFYAQFFGGIMGPIMGNTSQVSYALTVGIGGVLMCTSGLTPGALTVFAGYSKQFSMPINQISMQMSTIFAALAGAERVFAVMDETPEAPDAEDAVETPITGDVVLKDVTFGYVPEKTVLKNISLYAHPGQKIAFVGSTGAGKTTITNLLNRFYDIDSGEITIDGVPLKKYKRAYLRQNIAMVLQDTHLFTGSVRENIRYGRPDATDEEVVEAAKTASAHSFIMRLEHGYDTVLEGDGANLSQGQRQLLNIARAAISKAPILVLDEATSSIDTRTEIRIQKAFAEMMRGRTSFIVAHRLSTVREADVILVMKSGHIIEQGTHDELMEKGGFYRHLYDSQFAH